MTTINTLEDMRAFVVASTEPRTIPDAVSAWAERNAGKPLTVRNCPEGLRVVKQYGMTSLESPHSPDGGYYSFLIAHEVVNVMIPTVAALRDKNPAYYSGLGDRNHKRMGLANDHAALNTLFYAFQELRDAAANYHRAVGVFEEVCDYPTGAPDYYELRKLAGWIEEKR